MKHERCCIQQTTLRSHGVNHKMQASVQISKTQCTYKIHVLHTSLFSFFCLIFRKYSIQQLITHGVFKNKIFFLKGKTRLVLSPHSNKVQIPPAPAWFFPRCSSFLPQSKKMLVRQIGDLPVGVSVNCCLSLCASAAIDWVNPTSCPVSAETSPAPAAL